MTPPEEAAVEDADVEDAAGEDLAVAEAITDAVAEAVAGVADEELAGWLAALRRDPGPSCEELGVESLRRSSQADAAARPRGPDLTRVQDVSIDDVLRGRLYRTSPEPRPLVLFTHGGGFVMGDLNSHDRICRRLAASCDVAVLAVDYRRAPEFPAPAAVDDAVRAFGWALSHQDELGVDPGVGIALAGDSSGAAIAVLAAIRLRDSGGPGASALLLLNPNTDMTLSQPSMDEEGAGWGLDAGDMRWFVEQWVPDPGGRADPTVSPLFASLAGLPPTLVATAEHDPLRDEGEEFAMELMTSGVTFEHCRLHGMVHGFMNLDIVSPAAARAGDDVLERFAGMLPRSSDS
jgi:acetyl esterase